MIEKGARVRILGGFESGLIGYVGEIEHRPPAGHDRPGSITHNSPPRDFYRVQIEGTDKVLGGFNGVDLEPLPVTWPELVDLVKRTGGDAPLAPFKAMSKQENLTLDFVIRAAEAEAHGTGTGTAEEMAAKIKAKRK